MSKTTVLTGATLLELPNFRLVWNAHHHAADLYEREYVRPDGKCNWLLADADLESYKEFIAQLADALRGKNR